MFQVFACQVFRDFVQCAAGYGQDAEGLGAHLACDGGSFFQIAPDAAVFQHVEGALCDGHDFSVYGVDGGHELSVGVKGQLSCAGMPGIDFFLVNAVFAGCGQDACFRGISDVDFSFFLETEGAVAAEGAV